MSDVNVFSGSDVIHQPVTSNADSRVRHLPMVSRGGSLSTLLLANMCYGNFQIEYSVMARFILRLGSYASETQ